ncbi:MAG TPA: DUF1700 domain-containing protein [Spirochaetia bacterium]|nr:DUF1700 domain-containing protein [Spirochaetia bacterium]
MEEKFSDFFTELQERLSGFPDDERERIFTFYREYVSDALEAGKSIAEIEEKLGTPEVIAKEIKTNLKLDASLARTEESPGLKNLAVSIHSVWRVLTTPLSALALGIIEVVPLSLILAFFILSCATGISAVGVTAVFLYEAVRVPKGEVLSLIGTIGAALFAGGVFALLCHGFSALAKLCIRLVARIARCFVRRPEPHTEIERNTAHPSSGKRHGFLIGVLALSIIGFLLLGISGIPMTYYRIFDSEKPEVTVRELSVATDGLKGVKVTTLNSYVKVVYGTADTAEIRYEEPPWLTSIFDTEDGIATFREVSTGVLPLYRLASLHESLTEVLVTLPHWYKPEALTIESTGGHIILDGIGCGVHAKTLNGNIVVKLPEDLVGIRAFSKNGSITVGGKDAGMKSDTGTEFLRGEESGNCMNLVTTNGTITVE